MNRRPSLLLGVALFALALVPASGCAFARVCTGSFERPKVRIERVKLSRLSLSRIELELFLEVDNPNDVELTLSRIDYELAVEGRRVATGDRETSATLPALEKQVVPFPVRIDTAELGPVAAQIFRRGSFRYEVHGTAGLDTPVGVMEYPFRHDGTLGTK